MTKFMSEVAFAAALMAGVAAFSSAHASSLIDGSFEDSTGFSGNAPGSGGNATVLTAPGDTTIPGWTTTGTGTVLWAGPGSVAYMGGLVPSAGQYFLDLTGLTNQCPPNGTLCAGVSQTISTVANQHYQLSFDFAGRSDSIPVSILAAAGAASHLFTTSHVNTSAASWDNASLNFVGTGGLIAISLGGMSADNTGLDLSLDNVQVTAVGSIDAAPLPSTWLMLLSGFIGLGFVAYRGSSKATPFALAAI